MATAMSKKQSNIFTTRGAPDPKVIGTIESDSSSQFFWHLAKSDQTYSSGDINCWENSGGGGGGVHYVSKIPIPSHDISTTEQMDIESQTGWER